MDRWGREPPPGPISIGGPAVMFLLYLDGSGVPTLPDPAHEPYVLLGLAMHESSWANLEHRARAVRRRYERPGAQIELHAKDLLANLPEQEAVADFADLDVPSRVSAITTERERRLAAAAKGGRRGTLQKLYRATSAVMHMPYPLRRRLYEDALDLVGSTPGVTLFCEAVDKPYALRRSGSVSFLKHAFEQVVSRFDMFLRRENRQTGGPPQSGLLIMDREAERESEMRTMLNSFRDEGHRWGYVEHVIDAPMFIESHECSGVQLADICGYAVRRHVKVRATTSERDSQDFLRIQHRIDREGPQLHGARHYCERGSCPCEICRVRGFGMQAKNA